MKLCFKLFIGVFFVLTLTGCIGENYDFTPPKVSIMNTYDISDEEELEAANINWDTDKKYTKETKDIISFAREQKLLSYDLGEQMEILFDSQDFAVKKLSVYAIQNDKKAELQVEERTFNLPDEEGKYVIVVNLLTEESGSAEYVGNIVIQKSNETKDVNGKLPEFAGMKMPYIKKVSESKSDGIKFGHSYEEVCWNNCDGNSTYNYPEIQPEDIEIGDELQIDWHKVDPHPTEINLIQINTEDFEVVKEENIDVKNTLLKIEVDDANIDAQYALEFLWKEKNKTIGRSILNFRLK